MIAYLAFTEKGLRLAQMLAAQTGGTALRCPHGGLDGWTCEHFAQDDALVYVGAVGIAVRAVAPYLQRKTVDPAVVVLDECAHFAVPIVSGHLGGANALAQRLAALCGATAVITTATDANGVFAVDVWAGRQGCAVLHTDGIRRFSAKLLAGETAVLASEFPIAGPAPQGVQLAAAGEPCDAFLGLREPPPETLWLVPQIVTLGVGCRRGTPQDALDAAFAALALPEAAFCAAATIDRKADEPGLQAFCRAHRLPMMIFSAQELAAVPGQFSSSAFVQKTVGVDNVCERAAVLAAGEGAALIRPKTAGGGVTMAAAQKSYTPNWEGTP